MKSSLLPTGRFLAVLCLTSLVIVATAGRSAAQQATAQLTGSVKDPTGAVLVGAKVTLKNSDTNIARTVNTNKDGDYLFTLIPIGTYELTVEQQGFSKAVQRGIKLEINQNAHLDIALQLGTETQTVEVSSAVTQVDTISATLGKVETTQRILDLPLVDRDTLQLGLLQAGVFAPDPDDGSGNPFSVSGQRSESLTFLLDGADNNDFLGNNIVVSPNPDAVAEFKILTNNYNAEYGRTSGGIVNQVIKSGTNAFHGTVFEFLRNDVLNARDYFLPERTSFKRNVFGGSVGGPIIKDKTFFFFSYQGGRRREGQVAPVLTVLSPAERGGDFGEDFTGNTDPNTGLDTGQLYNPVDGTPYTDNMVPVNPVIANYIDRYMPTPNLPGNRFISGPVAQIREDQAIVRVDHNISSKDTLSGVYLFEDAPDFYPFQILKGASTGGNVPVGSGFSDKNRFQSGSLTWTHTISANMLNEFRFAANRAAYFQAIPQDTTSPADLGFTNVNPDDVAGTAPPIMFIDPLGLNLGPNPQGPTKLHDATFQFQDTVSWNRGSHNLKFGADLRWIRNNFAFDFFNNGSFFFGDFGNFTASTANGGDNLSPGDVLADFVGGFYDNYFQFSSAKYGIRTHSLYFFAQDSWKVLPRLTLDLGIRYEYNSPQIDPHDNIIGFFPGTQSTVFPDAPPNLLYPGDPGTPNRSLVDPDRNNFAPRVGFSWDILGNAKLVMRGGYGIFYDLEDGALNLQFGGQPPFGAVSNTFPFFEGISGDPVADPYTPFGLVNPFPFASAGKVGTFADPKMPFAFVVSPHFRTPYAQNFNFGFQYQATKDTMVEAVYVGSLSRKAVASNEVNFPLVSIMQQQLDAFGGTNPECARPLAACDDPLDPFSFPHGAQTLITNQSNANSSSHQFQLTVDKQVTHGLGLRAAYTMAKTIDISSGFRARSSTYTDPTNPAFDRGLADFDATHRLVISASWDIPWDKPFKGGNAFLRKLTEGWSVNPIISFQSGSPFSLFQNNNSSQLNNFLDRPDQLGPVKVFGDPREVRTINLPDPTVDSFHGSCAIANGTDPQTLLPTVSGNFWFDPTNLDCANVPLFSHGNMGRNVLRGPGINNWDLSFRKETKLTETTSLEFRGEMFNAFNHAQFLNPDLNGFSPTFGQVTTARPPRLVQFALKFIF